MWGVEIMKVGEIPCIGNEGLRTVLHSSGHRSKRMGRDGVPET